MNERQVFEAALELPQEDRAPFLDSACSGDTTLRQRLDALLKKHDQAGSFLEEPVDAGGLRQTQPGRDAAPRDDEAGLVLAGRYKLLEQIGEGGMGTVWMTHQTEPVRRTVAVKLIKSGAGSKAVLARFEAERQALALMDHPNIAKVLDAGTSPDGRPFFVMELVKGVPITTYCDLHHLTPRERLELFVPVCQAIQHAHHKGIIHRDLKPSNVLVAKYDDRPVPKVIDFGVAKATGQQLTEATLNTGFGAVVGTVEYMSPEQASFNPWDIDTRSDIYSLGVLLYELLTGSPPFNRTAPEQAGILEMLRVIREVEPSKPSKKLSTAEGLPALAANRGTEPKRLATMMRGELDWIVMKALDKDRSRRYETANGFASDIQRYLADEPVQACPPSAGYRLRKFVRRNKRALASATLLGVMLLALVGVVAGSLGWVARDRAARQADLEREVGTILGQATLLRDQGKWSDARATAQNATRLAEQSESAQQRGRIRHFRADLEMAARLDDIGLWLIHGTDLATWADARAAYAAAFRDYGIDLADAEPAVAAERIRNSAINEQLLAALDDWSWNHESSMLSMVGAAIAGSFLAPPARAQKKQELLTLNPLTDAVSLERLRDVANLADRDEWRRRLRSVPAPVISLRDRPEFEALASTPEAAALPPATALLLARGLFKSRAGEKALEVLYAVHQRHPDDVRLNFEIARYLRFSMPGRTQLEKAGGFIRSALALRPQSAALHFHLGECLVKTDEFEQAVPAFRKVIELQPEHARAHFELGRALARKRAVAEALAAFNKALEFNPESHQVYLERGRLYAELGRWNLAAADYDRFAALYSLTAERSCEYAGVLLLAGKDQAYQQEADRAVTRSQQGTLTALLRGKSYDARSSYLAARTAVFGPNAVDPAQVVKLAAHALQAKPKAPEYLHTLGMAHLRAGEFDEAIRRVRESAETNPAWQANVINWLALAIACHRAGRIPEARDWMDKAVHWLGKIEATSSGPTGAAFPGWHMNDWLACCVLRREAAALLGAAP